MAKHKRIEGIQCIFYACPDCLCKNTIRINVYDEIIYDGRCLNCKKIWTLSDLEKYYLSGDKAPPADLFHQLSVEYICDNCATCNVIIPDDMESSQSPDIDDDGNPILVSINTAIIPEKVHCTNCDAHYRLRMICPG